MTVDAGPGAVGTGRPDPRLLQRLRTRVASDALPASDERLVQIVREEGGLLGGAASHALLETLRAELAGAGPLEVLLREPGVTDVLVNGPDQVWIDRGGGLERTSVRFRDEAEVRRLADRLAARVGRRLDAACPWVDGRLPRGVRLHAVVPPVAVGGTVVSLRVMAQEPFTLARLDGQGGTQAEAAALLGRLVRARLSFLVTGGTGTGKTTLLGALLSAVPVDERLVLVEDTCELVPLHPHVVRLEGRPANVEGAGSVDLAVLVRQALRMRPDRLVVGEVRGAEVVDLLAALNTGHEGGCGTLHARSLASVPARVEALAMSAGLSRAAVHSQLAAAVEAVVHLARDETGHRRVSAVGVLSVGPDGLCTVLPGWSAQGQPVPGQAELERRLRTASGAAREDG